MALKIGGIAVVNNARGLTNITSADSDSAVSVLKAFGTPTASQVLTFNGTKYVFSHHKDAVSTLTGSALTLTNANGGIIDFTPTANTTVTDALSIGDSIVLMINPGAFTITWPTTSWKTNAGSAPTLTNGKKSAIVFWKVSTTLYGARVGDN